MIISFKFTSADPGSRLQIKQRWIGVFHTGILVKMFYYNLRQLLPRACVHVHPYASEPISVKPKNLN